MNRELPDAQAGFRKGRGARDQTSNIRSIIKQQESQKNIYLCFTDYAKLTMSITTTVENFSRDENTRLLYLTPKKTV